jgi:hypothetical protein
MTNTPITLSTPARRVSVPEFELVSNPTIRLSDMREGNPIIRDEYGFGIGRLDAFYRMLSEIDSGVENTNPCGEEMVQTHEGYWIEPENQTRENCFYCGGVLVEKDDFLICEECDKR